MASKRMFTMKICDSDAFLDMPLSSQCLYFHLNMRADDDGFIDNPKRIMKVIGASDDDLKVLLAKNFVLHFDSGVLVIKHWRMHNTLTKQRYHETQYIDEKSTLLLKENGSYSFTSGVPLDDNAKAEMFRISDKRRTSGEQAENADIDIGLDIDIDLDKDKGLDKEKEKKKKETPMELVRRLAGDYPFSAHTLSKIEEWTQYKVERREAYKETGAKSLLTKIYNNIELYGEDAVLILIDDSMANGWRGIIWDRLKKQESQGQQSLADRWRNI